MKKIIILSFVLVLFVLFSIHCFAFTPYGNVSESTSQINTLINYMINLDSFSWFGKWIAFRSGEYEYTLYYDIQSDGNNSEADIIRYYRQGSNYDSQWIISESYGSVNMENNSNYTFVGNIHGSLNSNIYQTKLIQHYFKFYIPFIGITLAFFVFRIRKRQGGINV